MSDDTSHLELVRAVLHGHLAPEAVGGGRKILVTCPTCYKPWLIDGPRSYPRLEPEQLAQVAGELQADVTDLPLATCSVCGSTQLGEITLGNRHRLPNPAMTARMVNNP